MRANNYHKLKNDMEDEIIIRIDKQRRYAVKDPKPIEIGLRVPIIELMAHKAAMTGRALQFVSFIHANPA